MSRFHFQPTRPIRSNPTLKSKSSRSRPSLRNRSEYYFDHDQIEMGILLSDDDEDQQRVRTRRLNNPRSIAETGGSIVIVEKSLLPNESIQAFAIRYRVPVSQLKRLNNLQNEQEFYALTTCRVPVRRFGLLHQSDEPSTPMENDKISIPVTHLSQTNHHAFLKAMDEDLALMRTKIEQVIERPSTSVTLVPQDSMRISGRRPVLNSNQQWNCDEPDWTCKTWQIIIVLILIALIPFLYVYFYLKARHSKNF